MKSRPIKLDHQKLAEPRNLEQCELDILAKLPVAPIVKPKLQEIWSLRTHTAPVKKTTATIIYILSCLGIFFLALPFINPGELANQFYRFTEWISAIYFAWQLFIFFLAIIMSTSAEGFALSPVLLGHLLNKKKARHILWDIFFWTSTTALFVVNGSLKLALLGIITLAFTKIALTISRSEAQSEIAQIEEQCNKELEQQIKEYDSNNLRELDSILQAHETEQSNPAKDKLKI